MNLRYVGFSLPLEPVIHVLAWQLIWRDMRWPVYQEALSVYCVSHMRYGQCMRRSDAVYISIIGGYSAVIYAQPVPKRRILRNTPNTTKLRSRYLGTEFFDACMWRAASISYRCMDMSNHAHMTVPRTATSCAQMPAMNAACSALSGSMPLPGSAANSRITAKRGASPSPVG